MGNHKYIRSNLVCKVFADEVSIGEVILNISRLKLPCNATIKLVAREFLCTAWFCENFTSCVCKTKVEDASFHF